MARSYSNENFPLQTVQELRLFGHDVLTSFEAGNANRCVPDDEVLRYSVAQDRILLTQNRLHFRRLHYRLNGVHAGIVICTYDPDFGRLGRRIDGVVSAEASAVGKLLRVQRPDRGEA